MVPGIIDIEASGFGRDSYPIEVGLVLPDGETHCHIIRPDDSWTHWDQSAEAVHGIRRSLLLEKGLPPNQVAAELNRLLAGNKVYTDAWSYDISWLGKLYDLCGLPQLFRLESLRMLMSEAQADLWAPGQRTGGSRAQTHPAPRQHRRPDPAKNFHPHPGVVPAGAGPGRLKQSSVLPLPWAESVNIAQVPPCVPVYCANCCIPSSPSASAWGWCFPFMRSSSWSGKDGLRLWFAIGCVIAGLTIGVANYLLCKWVLLRRLSRISQVAQAISNKNLRMECSIQSKDLVGDIIDSFNQMTANLRAIVKQIFQSTEELERHTNLLGELADSHCAGAGNQTREAEHVVASMEEITDGAHSISGMAEQTENCGRQRQRPSAGMRSAVHPRDRLHLVARPAGQPRRSGGRRTGAEEREHRSGDGCHSRHRRNRPTCWR